MYEYESGTIPNIPDDFQPHDSDTDVQLLQKIIEDQQTELKLMSYQLHKQDEDQQANEKDLQAIIKNLDELIDQGSTGSSTLQDSNTQMLSSLKAMEGSLKAQHDTNMTIDAYGHVYVPLILVVTMLWWFFRQFISSYK